VAAQFFRGTLEAFRGDRCRMSLRDCRTVKGTIIMTEVDKQRILQVLRDRGLHARAQWAERELPDRVDLERNAGLLATLHISPADLADPPGAEGAKP
jgi:hypothetical protein